MRFMRSEMPKREPKISTQFRPEEESASARAAAARASSASSSPLIAWFSTLEEPKFAQVTCRAKVTRFRM